MGGIREDRMTVDLTAIEIERRLTAIETTLETTLPTFATKADIQSVKVDLQAARAEWKSDLHSLTRWMVLCCPWISDGCDHHYRINRPVHRFLKRPMPE